MKKSVWIIGIIVVLVIVSFFSINKFFLSPIDGVCKVISENPGDKKIDIVYFYSAGEVDGCKIVQGNVLLCYSKEIVKQSSLCKNDYVVVLSDRERNIRSSSYMNVMSININHPNNVLLHEFGHAFSRLADEYVPSVIPRGAENCQKDCDDFDVEGCYKGCSKSSYYRSSEKSIMRSLTTSDFEELNTKIIEEDLLYYE